MKRKRTNSESPSKCPCNDIRACGQLPRQAPARLWRVWCRRWTINRQDLVDSASSGCSSCGFLVTAITASMPDFGSVATVHLQLSHSVPQLRLQLEPGGAFYLYHPAGYGGYEPFGHDVLQAPRQPRPARLGFNIDKAIRTIEKWLSNCLESHPQCESGGFMPRRLLDVGVNHTDIVHDPIRLVSLPRQEPFVTLSHCWGKTQHATTTKANYHDRFTLIPMADLSKTFQDAVWLTRRLGIRYLWIDSICIVQDDPHDWAHEASTMSRIYAAAHLTIAASHGTDGSAGILYQDGSTQSTVLDLDHILPDGQTTTVAVELIPGAVTKRGSSHVHQLYGNDDEITNPSFTDDGLLTRAWAFQERALSTRIVHFTRDEMVWECKEKRLCECGGVNSKPLVTSIIASIQHSTDEKQDEDGKSTTPSNTTDSKYGLARTYGKPPQGYRTAQRLWEDFVLYYTTRKLTKPEDRGPAFAGIAEMYGRMMRGQGEEDDPGEYHDGIWLRHLPEALLWTCVGRRASKALSDQQTPASSRIKGSVAPSWSWYSVNGRCRFVTRYYMKPKADDENEIYPLTDVLEKDRFRSWYDHDRGTLTLTHVRLAAATKSFRSHRFKLSSPLPGSPLGKHRISLKADDLDDQGFAGKLFCLTLARLSHIVHVACNPPPSPAPSVPLTDEELYREMLMELQHEEDYMYDRDDRYCDAHAVGLALVAVPSEGRGTYRRIGLFMATGSACVGKKCIVPVKRESLDHKFPQTEEFIKHWLNSMELGGTIRLV